MKYSGFNAPYEYKTPEGSFYFVLGRNTETDLDEEVGHFPFEPEFVIGERRHPTKQDALQLAEDFVQAMNLLAAGDGQ